MTQTVLIADDHRLVRAGLVSLIASMEGFEVIAQADNGVQALDLARDTQPHLALLDINMPGLNGLDCLAGLRSVSPNTRALVLSMHATEEHVRRAFELGAKGYVLKESTATDLELALKSVAGGNIWLSTAVSEWLVPSAAADAASPDDSDGLSSRQKAVLIRLAQGATVKEIAFELGLSSKTVDNYRTQVMERLQLSDLPALVRYAIRNGWVAL